MSEKSAVIYARYSSHAQREESIEGQLRICRQYAEREKLTVVGEYADRAISGRTDRREQFQKMIRDAEKERFSVVIVYKLDRFARNRYDSAMYKAKLKKCGVKVLSATEGLTDTPESIILEAMLEGMAEYYSANLSQNVKRGMTENAMKCLATGGGRCLGYYTGPDKTYHIDEVGAATVRLIFSMYAQGYSYSRIAATLKEQGRTARNGRPFNGTYISKILRNRRYVGDYVWGDVIVEGGMPQIIDRDLWEKVQEKLKRNEKRGPRSGGKHDFILTGKLFCGKCGHSMVGDSGTGKNGTKHYYYTCVTKKRGEGCDKKSIPALGIENDIIRVIADVVLKDEMLEHIADKVMEYQARDTDSAMLIAQYKDRLKETQLSIDGIIRAMEAGIVTPSMKDRIEELEAQKIDLQANIESEEINQKTASRDDVLFFLTQFQGGDLDDPNFRCRLVDTFLNSVWVYDNKYVLTFNYSGDKNKVTLDMVGEALGETSSNCSDKSDIGSPIETKANTFILCSGVFALVKTNAGSTQ